MSKQCVLTSLGKRRGGIYTYVTVPGPDSYREIKLVIYTETCPTGPLGLHFI